MTAASAVGAASRRPHIVGERAPRTLFFPLVPPEHNAPRCETCGDSCSGNLTIPFAKDGQVADTWDAEQKPRHRWKPACKLCRHAWERDGWQGIDDWLHSLKRRSMLERREARRHRSVAHHRVVANVAYASGGTENTLAEAWALVNGRDHILRRLTVVPCDRRDGGAIDQGGGGLFAHGTMYYRDPLEGGLTERDCAVAATAVQWLGTNVGFCWLEETLKAAGYELRRMRKD